MIEMLLLILHILLFTACWAQNGLALYFAFYIFCCFTNCLDSVKIPQWLGVIVFNEMHIFLGQ